MCIVSKTNGVMSLSAVNCQKRGINQRIRAFNLVIMKAVIRLGDILGSL
jgi:hypothetical protein